MKIIYLAGNSIRNKAWIERVKTEFSSFSEGSILYYDHWTNGNSFIDFQIESSRLSLLVKEEKDYCIFAKSVGSILALKTIYEKTIFPKKMILCGHPYAIAKEQGLPIDNYLESLTIPTTFVQNELDPLYSFSQLEDKLTELSPANYHLQKIPNNSTHDYDNYADLINLAKSFFL